MRKKFHGTRGKQKIARIDPDQLRTVSQIHKWLAERESNSSQSRLGEEDGNSFKTKNDQPSHPLNREELRLKLVEKLDALKSNTFIIIQKEFMLISFHDYSNLNLNLFLHKNS